MSEKTGCGCSLVYDLVFACSGASDVGEISDRTARRLRDRKTAVMSCGIGVAANVAKLVGGAKAARRIVAIDGCDSDCLRRGLSQGGVQRFAHLRVTDVLGAEKGKTPVTTERIEAISEAARAALKDGQKETCCS